MSKIKKAPDNLTPILIQCYDGVHFLACSRLFSHLGLHLGMTVMTIWIFILTRSNNRNKATSRGDIFKVKCCTTSKYNAGSDLNCKTANKLL